MSGNAVRIVEVGPRDGLQNIKDVVPTATKIELIRRLAQTGLRTIEATSFVSPKWVPQLSDARDVMESMRSSVVQGDVSYPVLVPNMKGLEAAMALGVQEIGIFLSATDGFSRNNINCSVEESLVRARAVVDKARGQGIRVRGLGDTTGTAIPKDVRRLLEILLREIPAVKLAGHFHDSYGQAVANVKEAYQMGIRAFDSSVGGLGGCPYSPGAKGNVATEDVVYLFENMGIDTGVDLTKLANIGDWISQQLRTPNGSQVGAAFVASSKRAAEVEILSRESSGTTIEWQLLPDL
ncbi:unnamed protein product, partial [Aureobasidium pullulans]